jgi:hypothetical protein
MICLVLSNRWKDQLSYSNICILFTIVSIFSSFYSFILRYWYSLYSIEVETQKVGLLQMMKQKPNKLEMILEDEVEMLP